MKQLKTILVASLFVASLFVVNAFTTINEQAAAGNAHVSGGGTALEGDELSTFVFNAIQKSNGTVTGHLNYNFRQGDLSIKATISCLRIAGNRATLSGVITKVVGDNTAYPYVVEGASATFTVQDNGQGSTAEPDMFSNLIVGDNVSCTGDLLTYIPISGNIDIKE